MNRAISLLTDFGLEDEYVGVMKGVILRHCPSAQIVDLSHAILPHNIILAARTLLSSYVFFAPGTIHLAVVDPGVGTDRSILLVEADGHLFIAPDNGLLSPLLHSKKLQRCLVLDQAHCTSRSATFHGRDLMAPIAGKVAAGADFNDFGHEIEAAACCRLDLPSARRRDDTIEGEIVAVDHFGNITTSISQNDIVHLSGNFRTFAGKEVIVGLSKTYAEGERHKLLTLVDSRGFLEIAINCGNAAKMLGCEPGAKITVQKI